MRLPCFDVTVVGGGIVGAACAEELARSGLRVAICEAGIIGGGATAAGMGHLTVMDDSEQQFTLTRYSLSLWNKLAPELPPEVEFFRCGAIWVAADEEEMAEVHRKHRFYANRSVCTEILDSKQLQEAEPHLRAGLAGGLLVTGDSVCYPPCVARYLVEEATKKYGASLVAPSHVAQITPSGVKLKSGDAITSKLVVLATGIWTTRLLPWLAIRPRKGHLLITDRYPGVVHHQLIELGYLKSAHATETDSVAFNIQPRATGQLLVGSSRQFAEEDPSVEETILKQMLHRAVEYMPALRQLSAIRNWAGFRSATPDKLPLIGPCPDLPHVYLATGHEGLGISTSLATARLLGDQILSRTSDIPVAPYLPERTYSLHAEHSH